MAALTSALTELPLELLDTLKSWHSTRETLTALLRSPYPPKSIYINATSNINVVAGLIEACLPEITVAGATPRPSRGADISPQVKPTQAPQIQDALPAACFVDCAEVASQKALFGRILNALSGWDVSEYDAATGGIPSWNGQTDGCSVVFDQDTQRHRIVWDTSQVHTSTIRDRKDESMAGFVEGLQCISRIGVGNALHGNGPSTHRSRFIVLVNAERIPQLEILPAGHTDGTLLAVVMRLAELTGMPVTPVLITSTEWLLLRPQKGGSDPAASISMPPLSKKDIDDFVFHQSLSHIERGCVTPQGAALQFQEPLRVLIDLLQQTFVRYFSDDLSSYCWLAQKCWPDCQQLIAADDSLRTDPNRLVPLLRARLTREIEALSELRPLASQQRPAAPTGLPARSEPAPKQSTRRLALSLSRISRYLLVSAYLASCNPAKKDVLMLATAEDEFLASKHRKKKGGAMRKSPKKRLGKEVLPQRLLGPKPFAVERLLAICECILPVELRHLARRPQILQGVATLTSLRLLVKTVAVGGSLGGTSRGAMSTSAFDKLDGIKLKCNVFDLETIEAVGKSIGFKVSERLWEAL